MGFGHQGMGVADLTYLRFQAVCPLMGLQRPVERFVAWAVAVALALQ